MIPCYLHRRLTEWINVSDFFQKDGLVWDLITNLLQAKHTQEGSQTWGVNGETGALVDMKDLGIWEPLAVKLQTYKTAVEVRKQLMSDCVLLTLCAWVSRAGNRVREGKKLLRCLHPYKVGRYGGPCNLWLGVATVSEKSRSKNIPLGSSW